MANQPQDLARTTLAILFIGVLIVAAFLVVRPFLAAIVWATTLVIATWPLMLSLQTVVGGRRWLAVTVMTIGLLLVVLLPLSLAIAAIVARSDDIANFVADVPNLRVPRPPSWLTDVPVVGSTAVARWERWADAGLADLLQLVRPYVGTITRWFVGAAGSLGGLFVHLLLTIAIAAILYATGEQAAAWCRRFGRRLAAQQGEAAVVLAGQAIRSVALGVVVTAVAQTLVASLGLFLVGVPQAGLLSAIILLLCIAQLGPGLVMIPAVIWLFVVGATGAGILLTVFTVAAIVLDNFLRPLLIRRGADLPLLLILAGVIGGMLSFGLLGLFLGPVILAIAYTLLQHWISEVDRPGERG
jgi:predicted PurR-regulated permease PerM